MFDVTISTMCIYLRRNEGDYGRIVGGAYCAHKDYEVRKTITPRIKKSDE